MEERLRTRVSIAKITGDDANRLSDPFKDLKKLISAHEELYPDINTWFNSTVVPELKADGRAALVGYEDDSPVASAIVKPRRNTKFCHLHIAERHRGKNLGELFFSLMAFEARQMASRVHFTLPESLWEEEKDFFESFGFSSAELAERQYRSGEKELVCSASFENVWLNVRGKLSKLVQTFGVGEHNMSEGVVLAMKPDYAHAIMDERKVVEIRRRFARRWAGSYACIYATDPVSGLVGEARIEEVVKASPDTIWSHFGQYTNADERSFQEYTSGCDEIYAIIFGHVAPYISSIPLSQISYFIDEELSAPQSYVKAVDGNVWSEVVALATLLQRRRRFSDRSEQGVAI